MSLKFAKQPQDYLSDESFVAGLITGAIAGMAIGLLATSRSGKQLREQIAGATNDKAKQVRHQWEKTKAKTGEAIDHVKTDANRLSDKVQDEAEGYANKAEKEADHLADKAKSGFDKIKETFNLG